MPLVTYTYAYPVADNVVKVIRSAVNRDGPKVSAIQSSNACGNLERDSGTATSGEAELEALKSVTQSPRDVRQSQASFGALTST